MEEPGGCWEEFGEVRSRGDEVRLADPPGRAAERSGGQPGPLVPPQSSLQHRPQQRAAALSGTEDPTNNASLYKNVQHCFLVPNMMHEKFFENDKNAQRPAFLTC